MRITPNPPSQVHVSRFDGLPFLSRQASHEPNVRDLDLPARVRAARPVHSHGAAHGHALLELLRDLQGAGFGLYDGLPAELVALPRSRKVSSTALQTGRISSPGTHASRGMASAHRLGLKNPPTSKLKPNRPSFMAGMINSSNRVPNWIPHIVHATLQASQPNFIKSLQNLRHIRQHNTSDLPILPGLMLSPMKEAKPFESTVNIIFGKFGLVNLFKGYLGKLFNFIFHEQLHWFLLNLNLFCRIYALSELFLENKVTIFFLHPGLQSCGVDLRGSGCWWRHRLRRSGMEPSGLSQLNVSVIWQRWRHELAGK
nr:hypothetical protein Iba_chr04eCG2190 [Ipomoea batatas]